MGNIWTSMAVLGGTLNARFRERLRFRDEKRINATMGNIDHIPRTGSVSKRCRLQEMEDLRNGNCFPREGIQTVYSTAAYPNTIPIPYIGTTDRAFHLATNGGTGETIHGQPE